MWSKINCAICTGCRLSTVTYVVHLYNEKTHVEHSAVFFVLLTGVSLASDLKVNWEEEDQRLGNVISVPPEVYAKGCVRDVHHGLAVSIFIIISPN